MSIIWIGVVGWLLYAFSESMLIIVFSLQGRDHADHHKKTDAMKYGNTRSHGVETEKKGGAGK